MLRKAGRGKAIQKTGEERNLRWRRGEMKVRGIGRNWEGRKGTRKEEVTFVSKGTKLRRNKKKGKKGETNSRWQWKVIKESQGENGIKEGRGGA